MLLAPVLPVSKGVAGDVIILEEAATVTLA